MNGPGGRVVLDSSVLLAFIKGERGSEVASDLLPNGVVSSVIWAETNAVCYRDGLSDRGPRTLLLRGVEIAPFTAVQAELAAGLHMNLSRLGLSLADCACLALGLDVNAPVYTADSAWEDLDQDVDVRVIR
jgi:ribonuclease VapC